MNVRCPHCSTTYRVDPQKVPSAGVPARCSRCSAVFLVAAEASATPPAPAADAPAPAPPPNVQRPDLTPVGAADPHLKARRLARALVSDIAVYHPERRDHSLDAGSLREEFRDEIRKSWEAYVADVGEEMARSTAYFRDALNEILARGRKVF